jgi:hypothetical protein
MIDLTTFTWLHTALSLVALASGFFAVIGILTSRPSGGWTALFLVSAVATSATGFGFPFDKFIDSHWVGLISLVVLLVAIIARYAFHLAGAARWIYAAGVVLAEYFLVLVAIAQAFKKIPSLHALAPTGTEPAFTIAQVVALVVFVVLMIAAAVKFRPAVAR